MTSPLTNAQPAPLGSFRRRVAWLVSVAALLLIVRLIWGHYTGAALRQEVAAIRQRGEPIELADFAFEQIPDVDNAAVYQMDAARAFAPNAMPPRASNIVYPPSPP